MSIKRFVFNDFKVNTYLYIDDDSKQAAVIDPGMYYENERKQFFDFVKQHDIILKYVILTHGHFDHFCGGEELKRMNIPFVGNQRIKEILNHIGDFISMFGIEINFIPELDVYVSNNDVVKVGNLKLEFIETPGHCPGHLCIIDREQKNLFSGDLLFHNSIGRTDFPGGDYDALVSSIKDKILSMKENYTVFPGHGPDTTISDEILSNPFLTAMYK